MSTEKGKGLVVWIRGWEPADLRAISGTYRWRERTNIPRTVCAAYTQGQSFKGQAQATPSELLLEETLKMTTPGLCRAVGLESMYRTRLLSPHQDSVSHPSCYLRDPLL